MPSKPFKNFKKNEKDVLKLIQDYHTLNSSIGGRGKRALDHLTRSGVLLLAGAWELYIEELLKEAASFLASKSAKYLPKEVKQQISNYVKKHDHELKPLDLVGKGWKDVYINEIVIVKADSLNTPKKEQIDDLFEKLIGIKKLSDHWSDKTFINDFVSFRGTIAHRIKADEYVKVHVLQQYLEGVRNVVKETDLTLYEYLKNYLGRTPWNNTY